MSNCFFFSLIGFKKLILIPTHHEAQKTFDLLGQGHGISASESYIIQFTGHFDMHTYISKPVEQNGTLPLKIKGQSHSAKQLISVYERSAFISKCIPIKSAMGNNIITVLLIPMTDYCNYV